ncbi:zinc finger protein 184-like [Elysia marginata]|uniref:Zinc finger protein 184-like n=1 Tax=Elysia marginata TaxID=1093978 RepID=A0AAV4IU58_9GAST|nr:zinc finger protein 184-like [Elysia marginata]
MGICSLLLSDRVNTVDGSLIEKEVEDSDPTKKELDFLVGSSNYVKCHQCHEKFTSIDVYYDHVKNHPIYVCKECGMEFSRQFNLTRHMRYDHEGAAHLICKLCGTEGDTNDKTKASFKAKTEAEFRRHHREVHEILKPFTCPTEGCSFSAAKYERLVRHQQIHNEEKTYVCDKCGQGFSQKLGLVSHQRACYHLQEYLCDLCGQSFNHAQSMRAHRRVVHLGEKRFKCSVCSNSFSDQRNLRRHMRIHENSFPYACPVCSQKYRHSNSLKAHMVNKHPGVLPEQLQSTNSQPRNKLGGRSYKPRSGKKSSKDSGTSIFELKGQANATSCDVTGHRGQKVKHNGLGVQDKSGQQDQRSQCFHPCENGRAEEQLQPVRQCAVSFSAPHLQGSVHAGFEVTSRTDVDLVMDPQTGLATLQVRTGDSLGQRDSVPQTAKGEQTQSVESLREYAAFLENQTSLYSVYPSVVPAAASSRHPPTATAAQPVDGHQLNRQNPSHHPLRSIHPPHAVDFSSHHHNAPTSSSCSDPTASDIAAGCTSVNSVACVSSNQLPGQSGSFTKDTARLALHLQGHHTKGQSPLLLYHQPHHHHQHHHQLSGEPPFVYQRGNENSVAAKISPPVPSSSVPTLLSFPISASIHHQSETPF